MGDAEAPRDRLAIHGIQVQAGHGVWEFERLGNQRFVVDCVIEFDSRPSAASDDMADTIEYTELARLIVRETGAGSVHLIETLAQRLADLIIDYVRPLGIVNAVEITVHKPDSPMDVRTTDIALTIRRDL